MLARKVLLSVLNILETASCIVSILRPEYLNFIISTVRKFLEEVIEIFVSTTLSTLNLQQHLILNYS